MPYFRPVGALFSASYNRLGARYRPTTDPTTATETQPRGRARRRLLQALIAAMAVSGAVGLTAGPASAAQTCKPTTGSNICLPINRFANGNYAVHVGIDVHMSLEKAQEYIDDPGDPFTVTMRGEDSGSLAEFLFTVPRTQLGASAEFGLSGDFDKVVPGFALNEDSGTDEVVAQIILTDTDTNVVFGDFRSNRIVGNFF